MPGQLQHTLESLRKEATRIAGKGVTAFMLFGVPEAKDPEGSQAWAERRGIAQRGLRVLREELGDDHVVIADLCLDEYTDHGHCGVLDESGDVDNDETLERYRRIAVAQASAGATPPRAERDDGRPGRGDPRRPGRRRDEDVGILAYAAKFAPRPLYGPFRDAAECAPRFGDRRGYQMGSVQRRRGTSRDSGRYRRGRGYRHGQARASLSRRHPSGAKDATPVSTGRLQRQRRVRDAQAGRRRTAPPCA